MQNFEHFLSTIIDYCNQNSDIRSVMQVTIRNHGQLSALSQGNELQHLNSSIVSALEKFLVKAGKFKIFQYNRHCFCFLESSDFNLLNTLSIGIHDFLVRHLGMSIFADTRFVATKIDKHSDIKNLVNLLSDQLHYSEDHSIFNWIEDADLQIKKLREDYSNLYELRKSISEHTACFAFQPIIQCSTGKVAYYECLLRLNNEDHKLISAGRYIMLAEKYGYINSVDKYVFENAIAELISAPDLSISINISNLGVQDKVLVNHYKNLLSDSGVGNRLIIEITETAMNDSFEQTKYFVDTMKSLGCKIALDDFGAGYTSFSQVRKFAVDIIKIDGSFITDINTNEKNRILVETIIKTAEELGCKTVAEFVENGSIAKQLIDLKVDYMQGNFFSPAINYRSWNKITKQS